MRSTHRTTPKCFFLAWIFGWVTGIFVPSGLIVAAALSPLVEGNNLLGDVFDVADEVAPAAKLSFAFIFAILLMLARLLSYTRAACIDSSIGAASMILVLALLPADWSRGFGVGLTGSRFAALPTLFYILGGLLSGAAFSFFEARCERRSDALEDR